MTVIYGESVDSCGRCIHYHLEEDIVAHQCFKCKKYYACYKCHNSNEAHLFKPLPIQSLNTDAMVLCGICHEKISYFNYKTYNFCPNCHHKFNPKCFLHSEYYFQCNSEFNLKNKKQ